MLETLFAWVLRCSLSVVWVMPAVLLLRLLFRRGQRNLCCILWALVAVRLLCPFTPESPLGLMPENAPMTEAVVSVVVPAGKAELQADVYPDAPVLEEPAVPARPQVLPAIWLAGVGGMLVYMGVSYGKIRRRVAVSLPVEEGCFLCDDIATPFVLGLFRPGIYLPSGLPETQWPAVQAHERAHLARKDHWWKLLGFLLLAVHWFNPLVWLAYRLLCRDMELACDQRVIRRMGAEEKKTYAAVLLACSVRRWSPVGCPLAFGEESVSARVKAVARYRKPKVWAVCGGVLLCALAAVCILTSAASPSAAEEPGSEIRTGYLTPTEDGFLFDEAEWIRMDQTDRIRELGLAGEESLLNNGFCIYNPVQETVSVAAVPGKTVYRYDNRGAQGYNRETEDFNAFAAYLRAYPGDDVPLFEVILQEATGGEPYARVTCVQERYIP